MRALVVEDYAPLRAALVTSLREDGWSVDLSGDGADALRRASEGAYDLVVLDVMLPELDGFRVLERLRASGQKCHVLLLTARDTVEDRVHGLDLGADDYLVKPFAMEELLARARALLRREYDKKAPTIRIAYLEIRTTDRAVFAGGERLELSAREYSLLEYFALRAGEVVTRADIRRHVYDDEPEAASNVVDVYVGYLRRKLEEGGRPRLLQTRRGQGYILTAEGVPAGERELGP